MASKSTTYRKAKWPVFCKKNKDGKVIEFTIEENCWAYVDDLMQANDNGDVIPLSVRKKRNTENIQTTRC